MSVDEEFAKAADLLADSEAMTDVVIDGKRVKIKKITVGEIADITKVAKDNQADMVIWLVYRGLVAPKLTVEQVRKLSPKFVMEVAKKIEEFSELDKASAEKFQNLSTTES